MNNLQIKILKILFDEKKEDISETKYQIVMQALFKNYQVSEITLYIARALNNLANRPTISLQAFFIDRAYEYLVYLNNAHEPSHETERLR